VNCLRQRAEAWRSVVSRYALRPFMRADLLMVAGWLRTSEVARWWGDPDEQIALVTEDLDEPLMRQWSVEHEGQPFAYVQAYPAHAWPQPHLMHLPDGAQVIDAFIGVPDMVGCGHGRAFLRAIAEKLRGEGAPVVAIDPARDNHRARRAYGHAGFVEQKMVGTGEHCAVVMIFR
jgi:aminoglycoside 6'-N-acetyltransferase